MGLIDTTVECVLSAFRKLRNGFAHSAESAALADPVHHARLVKADADACANPLCSPLDPALRDSIWLITVLVAFLEATTQELFP